MPGKRTSKWQPYWVANAFTRMQRRIFGIETEYGVSFTHEGQRKLSTEEVTRFLFQRAVTSGRTSNLFLENGGRLYIDVGSHPEYATAECDNLYDLVAQEQAGDAILNGLVDDAQRQLGREGHEGHIFLFKNNVDSAGNSYGSHENYCVDRDVDMCRMEEFVIPFLITRQIFSGAGRVVTNSQGVFFSLSQRAEYMWETMSSATTRSRPIINTRDEPHADPQRYRRLHVILGDSNMNQTATFIKVGTTAVILAMVEDRTTILRDYTLSKPMDALREVSRDLFGERVIHLRNGREMTALEMQEELCERAEAFVASRDVPADHQQAIAMWRDVLTGLRRDPLALSHVIDWVAKYNLIEGLRTREHLALGDPKIAKLDLLYHETSSQHGIFHRLAAKGSVSQVVSPQSVIDATTTAPTTTRARMRGAFIKQAKLKNRDHSVDWVHLKLNEQYQHTLLLKDPFASHDERFDRILKSL